MSTRYMWNRYDVGSAAAIQQTATMNSQILYGLYDIFNVLFAVTGIEFKAEGCVITSGYQTTIVGAGQYFMFMSGGYFSSPPTLPLTIPIGTNTQLKQAVTNCAITVEQQYDGMSTTGWFVTSSGTYADMSITSSKTLNGPVSSGISSAYPQNGMSGSYWYEYQGTDTIDPTGVDYVSSPKGGQPIDIRVTARPNTYGGTISYQYEVSVDGGQVWTQVGLDTAVTKSYTIPKGSPTFRARVQARDNMGFTSTDWVYGPQVDVINNSAPSAPPTITVPVSPMGGKQTTVTWAAASDVDGNLAGYELERQLDGGDWTNLYTGDGLSYVDTIPKGTLTAAYRVRAYDSDGDKSGYTTSPTRTVVNNSPPVISCDLSGDLGTKSEGFSVSYTVTDEDGDEVTVTEQVGELVKRTYTVTLGQAQSFDVTDGADRYFMRILNGPQTLKIKAVDSAGLSSVLELTFTKAVHAMSITLAAPLEVEDNISVAILSVLGSIPEDASYQVLVTNNAKDDSPVWEDATSAIQSGANIVFTNKTAANGPAFNFKLTASRGESNTGGHVKLLKGAFQ